MKLAIILLLAILPAWGVIAPVAHACVGAGPAGGTGTTAAIDTTGATLLIVTPSDFAQNSTLDTTIDNPNGGGSNVWHHITNGFSDGVNGAWTTIWYAWDHGGTPLVVGPLHTFSGTGNFASFCFSAWSGTQVSSDPLDQQNGNGAAVTNSIVVNSVTPSVSNCLVITSLSSNPVAPYTITGPFAVIAFIDANPGNWVGNATGYVIQTSAVSAGPTWTMAGAPAGVAVAIASFKSSIVASPTRVRHRVITQ